MEERWIATGHGAYYLLTGVWPIVHMPSFLAVTGPKRDLWLVKTVGVLVLAMAAALLTAGWTGEVTPPVVALAVAGAAAFIAVDVVYVAKRVIGPV